jgi:hypothetical protein
LDCPYEDSLISMGKMLRTVTFSRWGGREIEQLEDYLPIFPDGPSESDKTNSNNKKKQKLIHQKKLRRRVVSQCRLFGDSLSGTCILTIQSARPSISL